MADFRKWLIASAGVALLAMTANAQVGVAVSGGSSAGPLACTAAAAGTPELRPEGLTELVGDIVITCTGGPVKTQGTAVDTTNIVVYMAPSVPITSRWLASDGSSEAVLIVDEAGANVATGVTGAYGPRAAQKVCPYSQEIDHNGTGATATKSSCTPIVSNDGNGYEVPVLPTGDPAYNVFQGKVGDFGAHSVTFYNVPVLPPATTGVSRVFRITNIRVPIAGQNLASPGGILQAFISTSPSQVLPISQTTLSIGVVGTPMTAAVKQTATFQQCNPQELAQTATLSFTEGFATAFKTRVVPGGSANETGTVADANYLAEQPNTGGTWYSQNIPGGLYGGFAVNSESGLIVPTLKGSGTGYTSYTAGLADYGTRLKAVFTNVPAGLTLYVSTTSLDTTPAHIGGTSVYPYAVLVSTSNSDATSDGTAFTPVAATDGNLVKLPINSATNSYTAVWEVTNANPSAKDTIRVGVYVSYTPTSPTSTNIYGTPITDLPLGSPLNNVALSMAPEPSDGVFTTSTISGPIPRFVVLSQQGGRFITINLCQTTLLYPFVTGAAGFDTGIAVANTSMDPWGTINQTGSCKLYAYGVTVGASGNTPVQTTVAGCDSLVSSALPGTNCFDRVPSGQVGSVMASNVLTGFQGYVIAVCNFQYAHGYAAVTDMGLQHLWSSYLALELSPCYSGDVAYCAPGTVGSPRAGVQSIEQLVH